MAYTVFHEKVGKWKILVMLSDEKISIAPHIHFNVVNAANLYKNMFHQNLSDFDTV